MASFSPVSAPEEVESSVVEAEFAASVAALRSAFETSPDQVFAADAEGALLFVNAAGRARGGDVGVGGRAATLFPAEAQALFEAFEAGVRAGGPAARFQWGDLGPPGCGAGSPARCRRWRAVGGGAVIWASRRTLPN